jgi:hypothetical protein
VDLKPDERVEEDGGLGIEWQGTVDICDGGENTVEGRTEPRFAPGRFALPRFAPGVRFAPSPIRAYPDSRPAGSAHLAEIAHLGYDSPPIRFAP